MKYLKTSEQYKETGQNYYTKYLFNVGDIVKHRYKDKDRLFKITDRKYYTDPKKQNYINQYSIETIDDFLDEEHFELSLWPSRMWEYQSRIRNLTPEEQLEYKKKQESEKFNL